MKRTVATLILAMLTVAAVASLMMQPVRADVLVFTAQLLASNEVPPITGAESGAFGNVTVTLDTVANTARFDVSVNGLTTNIILSHIHEGAAGVIGPVRVDSGISPASPVPISGGSATFSRSGLAVPTDVRDRLLANPAGFYFNVHSVLNPVGVVRGQLVRQAATTPGGAAPTLSQWGVIIMTLLFIAVAVFFLVGRMSPATGISGAHAPLTTTQIKWSRLAKTALYLEVAVALASVALRASPIDAIGALLSGAIAAFILEMFVGARRR